MKSSVLAPNLILLLLSSVAGLANAADSTPRVDGRYTFTWPLGSDAPAPRGGSTRGVAVERDLEPSAAWRALQEPGLSVRKRDRRAILAMAGSYRVSFDFLEVAAFAGDGSRAQPYQSWGTERVFVDVDESRHISLVHILEMRVLGPDGKPGEPMVTKHWRQDWRYEPHEVIEYLGANRWARSRVPSNERRGSWSQTVHQVDESPRYGAVGRWEHHAAFSTWIGRDAARPLPRREWSVRKDYDVLRGTNRHTITPTGWLQEENNLKQATGAAVPVVAREYGVARYERLKNADFAAADSYYTATRAFWNQVLDVWAELWRHNSVIALKANSDQSGAFAGLFDLAEQSAAQRLSPEELGMRIRAALENQRATMERAGQEGRH